jgi:hypothetical protein
MEQNKLGRPCFWLLLYFKSGPHRDSGYLSCSAWQVEDLPILASSGVGRVPIQTTSKKTFLLYLFLFFGNIQECL